MYSHESETLRTTRKAPSMQSMQVYCPSRRNPTAVWQFARPVRFTQKIQSLRPPAVNPATSADVRLKKKLKFLK